MAPALHEDKEGDGGEDSFFMRGGAGELSGYNCILYKQGGGQGSEKGNPFMYRACGKAFLGGVFVSFLPEDNTAFYCRIDLP